MSTQTSKTHPYRFSFAANRTLAQRNALIQRAIAHGATQAEMCRVTGLSQGTISKIVSRGGFATTTLADA